MKVIINEKNEKIYPEYTILGWKQGMLKGTPQFEFNIKPSKKRIRLFYIRLLIVIVIVLSYTG